MRGIIISMLLTAAAARSCSQFECGQCGAMCNCDCTNCPCNGHWQVHKTLKTKQSTCQSKERWSKKQQMKWGKVVSTWDPNTLPSQGMKFYGADYSCCSNQNSVNQVNRCNYFRQCPPPLGFFSENECPNVQSTPTQSPTPGEGLAGSSTIQTASTPTTSPTGKGPAGSSTIQTAGPQSGVDGTFIYDKGTKKWIATTLTWEDMVTCPDLGLDDSCLTPKSKCNQRQNIDTKTGKGPKYIFDAGAECCCEQLVPAQGDDDDDDDDGECAEYLCPEWDCPQWCKCYKDDLDYDACPDDGDECDCDESGEDTSDSSTNAPTAAPHEDPTSPGTESPATTPAPVTPIPEGTALGCYVLQRRERMWDIPFLKQTYGMVERKTQAYDGYTVASCMKEAISSGALYFGMGLDASMPSGGRPSGGKSYCILFDSSGNSNIFGQTQPLSDGRKCCHKFNRHTDHCVGSADSVVMYSTGLGSFPNQPQQPWNPYEYYECETKGGPNSPHYCS